jgi:hypothetical protein
MSYVSPYKLVLRHLTKCWIQIFYVLPSYSKTMGFGTYDHIASQTVSPLNSIDNYFCRGTWRTVDSYPNLNCIVGHKLSAYPQGLIYSLDLSVVRRVISRTEAQMGITVLCNLPQNFKITWVSLSETILMGTPWK